MKAWPASGCLETEAYARTHTHARVLLIPTLVKFALDCLFHAFGFLISGDKPTQLEAHGLRTMAVRSVREFYRTPETRAAFYAGRGETVDAYTAKMEQPGVWADDVMLFFLARAMAVRCKMWTPSGDFELGGAELGMQDTRIINVAFVNVNSHGSPNHFEPVIKVAAREAESGRRNEVPI
jgi:hypothetical protein